MPINVVLDRMILGLMLAIVLTIACPVAAALWGQSHASASRSGPAASAAGIDGQRASRGV